MAIYLQHNSTCEKIFSTSPPWDTFQGFFNYMNTTFLVDGFNLYHSVLDIENEHGYKTKWLNLHSLFSSYLPNISTKARLASIYYFTALRLHLQMSNPDTILRHRNYIKVLKSLGINIEYGKFKRKSVYCNNCKRNFVKYEEKETDIAIINKLWELVVDDSDDAYVIITGDTDIIPGLRTIKSKFPRIKIFILFPYKRKNSELIHYADGHFKIKISKYINHQLNNPFIFQDGTTLNKPGTW